MPEASCGSATAGAPDPGSRVAGGARQPRTISRSGRIRAPAYRWLELVAGILTTLIGFVFGYLFRGTGGRSAPPRS